MSNRRHDSDDYEAQFPSRNEMDAQSFDLNSFASRGRQEAGRKSANGGGNGKKNSAPDKQRGSGSVRGTESRHGSAPRRSRGKKPKKKRGPAAKVGRIILSIFLIFVITGCLIVGTFAVYVFGFVDDTLDDDLNELKMDFTTTLYVKSGDTGEYVEYQRLHGEQNRIWISIDQMPEDLINAYIAIEDKRFLSHNGVDWKRTISAFANMFLDLYSSNQGGSTITQQLVKNLTGDNDQRPMRKIREIMRARYVENNYTKETIIECYLNTIALANGIYGVEVASNYYFGKSASELDVAECATLAAMAKEPERYRPDENPEDNKERRLTVLFEMYKELICMLPLSTCVSTPATSAISTTLRLPSLSLSRCTTISTPAAIWLLIASTGISTAIRTIVSSLSISSLVPFACPVESDPSCPVPIA